MAAILRSLITVTPGLRRLRRRRLWFAERHPSQSVNWQIDGVDNNDFWHNIPAVNQGGVSGIAGVVMPIDAIDEFSAQTQSSAEAGRNAGGTVNLALKSGGNTHSRFGVLLQPQRSIMRRLRPSISQLLLTPKPPRLRNENYGFTVGGPILKEHTFYFVGFEKQDYIIGLVWSGYGAFDTLG